MRFLFRNQVPECYERYLQRSRLLAAAMLAGAPVLAGIPAQAQQAKPKLTVEERIGKTFGPIAVRAALLEGANEELQAIIEQRDKTIADLQAQIAELKKAQEPK